MPAGRDRRTQQHVALSLALISLLAMALAGPVGAEQRATAQRPPVLSGSPVRSVFFIAKSENRNQVHYGAHVDEHCRPRGSKPVYGYWRNFEEGPTATSPLLDREQSAYGLTAPRSVRAGVEGGQVRIGLRGFPDRALTIEIFRASDGSCRGRALTTIRKQPAVLRSIYVELGFFFSIDYVLIRGYRTADGRPVQEKVDD